MATRGRPPATYEVTREVQRGHARTIECTLEEAAKHIGYSPSYLRMMFSVVPNETVQRRISHPDGVDIVTVRRKRGNRA